MPARPARLKIFFGFAPGVGKTFRMLRVARDLRAEGVDVVAGVLETHDRAEADELAKDLERLPGSAGLDLDAALARKPAVLLVDELAFSNSPGSRHAKRWQDVLELLDAGIDVYATLNVQHVESLVDVVADLTGVRVRETVPDSVLERADDVELVDVGPEQLLERLEGGKVHLGELAGREARFFGRGNLLALRELALRRTAERVDDDMRALRAAEGASAPWPAGERILVCVGPSPASARLVRAARRMAAGLRSPWIAAWVDASHVAPLRSGDQARLEDHLRLAESLGGAVVRLSGTRVSEALLAYARQANVTRIVIGKPTHSRLRDRLRGSLLDEVVRGSGGIDVHVISGDEDAREREVEPADDERTPARHWLAAMLAVGVTTGIAAGLRSAFDLPDVAMLYLLAIMAIAARFGRGPSLFAAALSVAAYDFFCVPPYFTFRVTDGRYVLTFAMMFAAGALLGTLGTRLRREERAARVRESSTRSLYALTKDLAGAADREATAELASRHASEAFDAEVSVWLRDADGSVRHVAGVVVDEAARAAVDWVLEHGRAAGLGTDTLPDAGVLVAPLSTGGEPLGVVTLALREGPIRTADGRALLAAWTTQVAVAIERANLAEEAEAAALRARTEEMRSSLLGAVSHDLRTPLAAITGAASAVRDAPSDMTTEQKHELLSTVVEEAERLERLVGNLLDMTRLESGGVRLHREWVPVEEMVGSALGRLEERLAARPVHVDLPADLPLVRVDPVLFEQVLVNLLENAAKYTPLGTALAVKGRREDGTVVISVEDEGPGIPREDRERVFEKFHRGVHVGVPGVGLGLAICRGIVEAHGGTIRVEEGKGAVFRIRLPIGGSPPAVDEA